MTVRIYLRASTKDQDAERALDDLLEFSKSIGDIHKVYVENYSGTKLDRPQLNMLLEDAESGDVLLVESVDRLSRLTQQHFEILKERIKAKGLRLIVKDLPTSYVQLETKDSITSSIIGLLNSMLIDLLATMARLDNEKRIERIKQGIVRSGYVPQGKQIDRALYKRIQQLNAAGIMTKAEIAKATGSSMRTVYRALAYDAELLV